MAEYTGYISIKQILDDLLAHPLLRDLSLERALDHAIHFMRIVGMPKMFLEKVTKVTLDEYRAQLPDDYYNIIQVREANSNITLQHTIDSHHMGDDKNSLAPSYRIQGNIIYSSLRDKELEVSYKALPIDEEGYPMLPDNSSFIKALELYIKKQYFTVLFDMGKITGQVLNNTQQEYAWYVGQCQSDLVRPTWDEMKSITNTWTNIIINKKYS
jgi:hypothetical protein